MDGVSIDPVNQQHDDTSSITQGEADHTTVNLIFISFISLPSFRMQLPVAVTLLLYQSRCLFLNFLRSSLTYIFNLLTEKNQ